MNIDTAKIRREGIRWLLLLALNNARPLGAHESVLLSIVQAIHADATAVELRRELGYLEGRELLTVKRDPSGVWSADLTRYGVDIAEYTIDCEPGIARPVKYWAG